MNYYDRFSNGDVRWYDWLAGLWLTIVVWTLGQVILTSPFMSILDKKDPETALQVGLIALAFQNDTALQAQMAVWSLLALIGLITAAIGFGIHYLGQAGRRPLIVGFIGAALMMAGAIRGVNIMSPTSEANTLLMSVIGLSPVAYMLMLLTFPAALAGLYLAWKIIHKVPLTALHTAWMRFRWRRAAEAFFIMWGVLGAYALIMTQFGGANPEFVFDPARFLPYAVISLLLLPIQSATEEIVVRGYMNKGLTQWFGNQWIAFILTSGAFMALHLANPEAQAGAANGNLPLVMSGYFFFGFAACLMVLIDDGLESAIGVHAANNTFAAIFINYENSVLPTPSIWQTKSEPTGDALSVIIVLSVVLGLLYLTRKVRPQ